MVAMRGGRGGEEGREMVGEGGTSSAVARQSRRPQPYTAYSTDR